MANEMLLKYGCNPNQKPSRVFMEDGKDLPIEVLNGKPGYINLLDAFNGWQLVRELKKATGMCAATSFKHVSPAGAAIGKPLSEVEKKIYFVDDLGELTPLASAYARARGADRMSSYGDFIALSDECDACTAKMIQREVSDGIIAPSYTDEALEILKGTYNIIKIDENYVPAPIERKQVFGVTFEQGRNELKIDNDMLTNIVTDNKEIPEDKKTDLVISLITLKYTQSNSVCYVKDRLSVSVQVSSQEYTAQDWQETRLTSGGSDSTQRFWDFSSLTTSDVLTEITLLTFTFLTSMMMYWLRAYGRTHSR
jgi:phosphoribosylaminoimidazolecarboxamide formyltransferase/IMP cyclohydrolase